MRSALIGAGCSRYSKLADSTQSLVDSELG